jgi:hypothetical protein
MPLRVAKTCNRNKDVSQVANIGRWPNLDNLTQFHCEQGMKPGTMGKIVSFRGKILSINALAIGHEFRFESGYVPGYYLAPCAYRGL